VFVSHWVQKWSREICRKRNHRTDSNRCGSGAGGVGRVSCKVLALLESSNDVRAMDSVTGLSADNGKQDGTRFVGARVNESNASRKIGKDDISKRISGFFFSVGFCAGNQREQ
jgi:hypothetical protein